MAHDVFISYSVKDKPYADAVCATLESKGARCWIAPRDVLPGSNYGAAIIAGLNSSRILVLVFSASSNRSPQVMREVERAVSKGLSIIPFRIEDVPLSEDLEYFLSSPHWLDALTPPLEKHLHHLADTVQLLLSREDEAADKQEDELPTIVAAPITPASAANLNPHIAATFEIKVLSGKQAGSVFPLSQARITIGRAFDNDIRLDDPSISRHVCGINFIPTEQTFVIVDFAAFNGITVNGQPVRGTRELVAGDLITVGQTQLIFQAKEM